MWGSTENCLNSLFWPSSTWNERHACWCYRKEIPFRRPWNWFDGDRDGYGVDCSLHLRESGLPLTNALTRMASLSCKGPAEHIPWAKLECSPQANDPCLPCSNCVPHHCESRASRTNFADRCRSRSSISRIIRSSGTLTLFGNIEGLAGSLPWGSSPLERNVHPFLLVLASYYSNDGRLRRTNFRLWKGNTCYLLASRYIPHF